MAAKPQPVATVIVCSECGLSWDAHKVKTLHECIRLLKANVRPTPWISYGMGAQTYTTGISTIGTSITNGAPRAISLS